MQNTFPTYFYPGYPFGLIPGQGYPSVSGQQPTAPGIPASQAPPTIQIPGIPEIGQKIDEIGTAIDEAKQGILDEIGRALTPSGDPWHDWNSAIADFSERWNKLFTGGGTNTATGPGIGQLGLPELAVAGVIGAIGLGVAEYWDSNIAFILMALILGGLFLQGNAGAQLAGSLNDVRGKLKYPAIIPSGS